MSSKNQPELGRHQEWIECPNCGSIEAATIQHTHPYWIYCHTCSRCLHTMKGSEVDVVPKPSLNLKLGQKVWIKSIAAYGQVRKFIGGQVNVYVGEGCGDALFEWDDLTWEGLENV